MRITDIIDGMEEFSSCPPESALPPHISGGTARLHFLAHLTVRDGLVGRKLPSWNVSRGDMCHLRLGSNP